MKLKIGNRIMIPITLKIYIANMNHPEPLMEEVDKDRTSTDAERKKLYNVIFPLYPKITVLYYFNYYGIFTDEVQLQVD